MTCSQLRLCSLRGSSTRLAQSLHSFLCSSLLSAASQLSKSLTAALAFLSLTSCLLLEPLPNPLAKSSRFEAFESE